MGCEPIGQFQGEVTAITDRLGGARRARFRGQGTFRGDTVTASGVLMLAGGLDHFEVR